MLKCYVAPPKTCWWVQSVGDESIMRCDHLFGLSRYYFRKWHYYVYILHIGRLKVAWYKGLKDKV